MRKVLADGTVREYRYAPWRPAPADRIDPDSVDALIREYERSPEWAALAPTTQSMYRIYLRDVSRIGSMRVDAVARRDLLALRDAIAATRGNGAASGFIRAASALFRCAVDRDRIAHSPTDRVRPLPGGHLPAWTMDEVQAAIAALPAHLARVVTLALYTGQRRGDLVRLTWSDYDGRAIRLRQQKTGRALVIPAHPALRAELDVWKREAVTILADQHGRSWQPLRLSGALAYHLARLDGFPPGRNIHGVRKLAAARLAEAGCTVHEIAAITGHASLSMVQLYTASVDQERLAGAAIHRLGTKVVRRDNRPQKTPRKSEV